MRSARRCRATPVGALLLADDEADAARAARPLRAVSRSSSRQLLDPEAARAEEPLLADGPLGLPAAHGLSDQPARGDHAVADLARAAGVEFVLGQPVEFERLRSVRPRGRGRSRRVERQVLEGSCRQDAVKPLWGVIVLVELAERPRHQMIEGTVTRGLTSGKIENDSPFTLLDSPSWLAVGSTLLDGHEPDGSAWAQSPARAAALNFVPCYRGGARPGHAGLREAQVVRQPPDPRSRAGCRSGFGWRPATAAAACRSGAASGRLMADAIIAGERRRDPTGAERGAAQPLSATLSLLTFERAGAAVGGDEVERGLAGSLGRAEVDGPQERERTGTVNDDRCILFRLTVDVHDVGSRTAVLGRSQLAAGVDSDTLVPDDATQPLVKASVARAPGCTDGPRSAPALESPGGSPL